MKTERLRKIANNAIKASLDKSLREKGDSVATASDDELWSIIIYYVTDEMECGNWEEIEEVFDPLGATEEETEEIMGQMPDYFGDEE